MFHSHAPNPFPQPGSVRAHSPLTPPRDHKDLTSLPAPFQLFLCPQRGSGASPVPSGHGDTREEPHIPGTSLSLRGGGWEQQQRSGTSRDVKRRKKTGTGRNYAMGIAPNLYPTAPGLPKRGEGGMRRGSPSALLGRDAEGVNALPPRRGRPGTHLESGVLLHLQSH